MGWVDAIAKVSELLTKAASAILGEQTLDEYRTEREATKLHGELVNALKDGKVGRANALYAKLVKLRDRAAARRAGQSGVSGR